MLRMQLDRADRILELVLQRLSKITLSQSGTPFTNMF